MPDSPTTRLGMYKSASDGSENVDYSQDIGQNLDLIDAAVGFQIVTSSTRPSSPYPGKPITESDTTYRTYFSNGTSPASASWVQIPNSSSTFDADLDLTSGKQINIGSSASTASFAAVLAATSTNAISLRVTGDTASRFFQNGDGGMNWGPGGAASTDVSVTRSGTSTLTVTGNLTVSSTLAVTGTASAQVETTTSGATAATNWTTTTFAARRTCGIATVYLVMTYSGSTITANAAGNITDQMAVTLPSGWRPAAGFETIFNKGAVACGVLSIASDGTCTLRSMDATATIVSGDTVTFSATYVL